MTIQISDVETEGAFNRYLAARNAPRDTIVYGVHPNAVKCLVEYDSLAVALGGGEGTIEDMSQFATYHANIVAAVTPFITMMYHAMELLRDTPMLINALAASQGEFPPFNALGVEKVDPVAYGTLLAETGAAIQAVGAILQGGGE